MAGSNKLTPKQEAFAREYIVDMNGKQAAIRVGYSVKTAESQASRLLSNAKVAARVQDLTQASFKRVDVRADGVLKELARIGYVDMLPILNDDGTVKHLKDWPEDVRRALAGIDVAETFEMVDGKREWTGYIKKIKFWDKPKSLELMGRNQKLFTDKLEITDNRTLVDIIVDSYEGGTDATLGKAADPNSNNRDAGAQVPVRPQIQGKRDK